VEAEAQLKKSTASASIFFKEPKPNKIALLETDPLTKNNLKKFFYLYFNHIGCFLS